MASIDSIATRFSGTVAYADGSWSYFHIQLEDGLLWSLSTGASLESMRHLMTDHGGVFEVPLTTALSGLGFMDVVIASDVPTSTTEFVSATGRFDFRVSFDNGEWAEAAVVWESGDVSDSDWSTMELTILVDDDRIAAADNIATVRAQLADALNHITDSTTIS